MIILLGIVLLIAGICIKPSGEGIQWSFLWGLSENSTPVGKMVFVAGSVMIFIGLGQMDVLV